MADPQAVMSPITALPLILSPKLSVGPYLSLGGRVWADCKKYHTHLDLLWKFTELWPASEPW